MAAVTNITDFRFCQHMHKVNWDPTIVQYSYNMGPRILLGVWR